MWLTNIAIKRPVAIVMLILCLVVLGLQGLSRMPAERDPKVDFATVSVFTTYEGAGPQEIETLITKPLEDSVASVSGVRNITSISQQGVSVLTIEFYLGTNLDVAAADVREKVDGAKRRLPKDVDSPSISKLNTTSQPILYLAMRSTGSRSSRDVRDLADHTVKDRLSQVTDVASVIITGGDQRQINVSVDKNRLNAYGLSISDVAQAIQTQNINVPSGRVTEGNRDYAVRVIGEFKSADEISNLRLNFPGRSGAADKTLRVGDLGTVTDSSVERTEAASLAERTGPGTIAPGSDAVTLVIQKTSDGNVVRAADGVKALLEKMAPHDKSGKRIAGLLPADIDFTITQDQSTETKENLQDVEVTLALGAFLAVMIVFLFLHNLRGTLIVALAIPTSIIATFLVMYAAGFTLNSQTLLGLSLATGILVDDSIVVLENIYRHLSMGETPQEAATNGRSEIGLAAVIITMVDVVVFVPVAFMGGIVGQFFRSFGVTVAVATLFSLFMSFTLAPMLASRWYQKGENVEVTTGIFGAVNRFYEWLNHLYRGALVWALHHRGTVIFTGNMALVLVILWIASAGSGIKNLPLVFQFAAILALGACVSVGIRWFTTKKFYTESFIAAGIGSLAVLAVVLTSGAVGKSLGFRFAPGQDQAQVSTTVELPAGASLAATNRVLKQIEDRVRDIPDVKFIQISSGSSAAGGFRGGGKTGTQYGKVALTLKDKANAMDRLQFWKSHADLRDRTDVAVAAEVRKRLEDIPGASIVTAEISGFGGATAPVQIQIVGPDLTELVAVAQNVKKTLAATPGVVTPDISYKASKPEVQVTLDRDRAAQYGLSVTQVANALRDSVDGNIDAKLRDNGEQYDIRVQYANIDRGSVADVGSVIVGVRGGVPVRIADVANVIEGRGPTQIDRKNRQRLVTVSAYLAPGKVIGNMQQVIDPELKKINFGKTSYIWFGEADTLKEEGQYMIAALTLAVLLVYMLMAALFNNPVYPFIIMLTIPQALVGGLLALLIAGTPLSIIAMIGVIMLMGLVTKNAILLVDFANTLRTRGYRREDALIEAGPTRLRPILMTTLAQICGTLPIALALGKGSEFRQPLGIVVIGGLSLSTLLTLLVIPCSYTLFDDITSWWGRVTYRRRPNMDAVLAEPQTTEEVRSPRP